MELAGKVALVTGAGSGIGKASAVLMAREGAKVGCLSRTESQIRAVADEIIAAGGEAMPLVADVADAAQMQKAVGDLVARYGRLDIVFANAGVNGTWAPIETLSPEEWDQTLNINLKGSFLTIKYAAPHLKKQGGSVILDSSVNGTSIFSNTGSTAYSCSKAGQLAMARVLAVELAPHNIRVNVICPGATRTEINDNTRHIDRDKLPPRPRPPIPLTGHAATPEQIAQLVLFLASDRSAYITGTPIWIDGGLSLVQG